MKKIKALALSLVVLILISTLVSCASPTAMKVGTYDVSYDMLRYFVMNYKNGYDSIDPREFLVSEDLQKALVENTNSSISELAAYYMLAREHGIKLTSEQRSQIKAKVEELRKGYATDEEYKADLEANFITEDVYREILTVQAYCDSLYEYLTDEVTGIFKHDDATIMGDIEAGNFFSAEYIYIDYSAKDYESRKAFAESIRERISNGEEMALVYAEYENEYLLSADYVKLGAFTYHDQNEYFEEAVLALKENECSEVIEQEGRLIIVKRLPLSSDYIDKNFNDIIARYLAREFFDYVEDYSSKLEIKMKGKYKDIKYWEIQ